MSTYDMLLSDEFQKALQDFFFIDLDKSQYETELLVEGIRDRVNESKEDIENMIALLKLIESKEEYENAVKLIDDSVSSELQALLEQEKAQDEEQVLSLYQEAQNVMGVCC